MASYNLSRRDTIPEIACVYKITNVENGMYYIGSTNNLRRRMYAHSSNCKKEYHIGRAISKHGKAKFEVSIIETFGSGSRSQLFEREQHHIDMISDWDISYNIGKTASLFDYDDPEYKHRHSESIEHTRKPIMQYSMDGKLIKEYASLAEAEQEGFDHSKVSMTCNRKRKSAFNFQWRFKDDDHDIAAYERTNLPSKIIMLDKKTNEPIATFLSGYLAAKWTLDEEGKEVTEKAAEGRGYKIRLVCRGKRPSAHGYKWTFAE